MYINMPGDPVCIYSHKLNDTTKKNTSTWQWGGGGGGSGSVG